MQKKFLFVVLSILTTSLFISFQSADAATDYFLKIEGIDGESTDSKHKNEIEIESWSWGETNSGSTSTGGGGGTGKVSMQDISFTKTLDKSSPKLFLAVATGQHIEKATLTARTTGEKPQEYLKITLENIVVTSYNAGGSSGDRPIENISLNFAKFTLEYSEILSDGTLGEKLLRCWSLASNQVCTSTGGGGDPQPDSDGDGIPDDSDFCPADPEKTNPGVCGCGVADTDTDGDGIATCIDACPLDPDNDIDSDGICGDVDNCPIDSNADQLDTDSDLAGNVCDVDDDNDGLYDDVDADPLNQSNEFNNTSLDGNEFGAVVSGNVIVTDVGGGQQISIGALSDSQISACDLALLSLSSGSEILVDCGSITVSVISGSVTAEYTVDGETATTTLDEGESLTFDPDTASFTTGDNTEVTITIGNQTITIGSNQTVTVQNVNVDIRPDDAQNVINLQAKGVLPVAILSSPGFDATKIDPLSVKFGPNGASESHGKGHIEDVNRDGLKDMMLHFNLQDIGIDENSIQIQLTGKTTDGNLIKGSDNVVVKGKKIKEN